MGVFYTHFYVTGTVHGVLIKGDVLISGVSLQRGFTVYNIRTYIVYVSRDPVMHTYSAKFKQEVFFFFPAAKEIKGHELLILLGIVIIQWKFSINFARNICYPQHIIYIHSRMGPCIRTKNNFRT